MSVSTQRGPLGDLREIPWGTPDADALARLLAPVAPGDALDRAAAGGKLRELIAAAAACADPSTERALAALADRPQSVRHVFRAPLDWTDPAVWDVHRALLDAFGEDDDSTDALARLAGIPLHPERDRPAADRWKALLERAAEQRRMDALLEAALADAAMADDQALADRIDEVRGRPWRVEPARVPVPSPPAAARPAAAPEPPSPPPKARRSPPVVASRPSRWRGVAVGALGLAAIVAAGAGLGRGAVAARRHTLGGTLEAPAVPARVVLVRDGRRVEWIGAGPRATFGPRRLDGDGDGRIDERWAVWFERTDVPCPPLALAVDPDAARQRWTAAIADGVEQPSGCRVRVAGLAGLAAGSVVALDAGVVEPPHVAVVERVDADGVAWAAPVGSWCRACWPTVAAGGCAEAVRAAGGEPAAMQEAGRGPCSEAWRDRLRGGSTPIPFAPTVDPSLR